MVLDGTPERFANAEIVSASCMICLSEGSTFPQEEGASVNFKYERAGGSGFFAGANLHCGEEVASGASKAMGRESDCFAPFDEAQDKRKERAIGKETAVVFYVVATACLRRQAATREAKRPESNSERVRPASNVNVYVARWLQPFALRYSPLYTSDEVFAH